MNLNLFISLRAILNSRTLTDAAKSTHVTQSAMSTSLRKLREHFDNPLISYSRGRTQLTPLAEALRPKVAEMLQLSQSMLKMREVFDPLTSRATFSLATIDSLEIVLLPGLLRIITEAAPHIKIVSAATTYSLPESTFEDGADVTFVPEGLQNPKLVSEVVYSDSFVCIVAADHPTVRNTITLEQYRSLPHVTMQRVDTDRNSARDAGFDAAYAGVEIAVTTRSFAALAHVVAGTNLVGVIPGRVARIFAKSMPIRIFNMPIHSRKTQVLAQWRSYKADDPAMNWLLETIRQAARQLGEAP